MENVIKHSQICLFVDDTVLYNSNINKETMELELQEDLTSLSRWLNNNELTINVKKSKVMTFSTHSRKIDGINLCINGQILDTVDTYKYLGLIIDNKLSFQNHIYHVSRQVNYKLRKLKVIQNNIHINTAVTIFKSVIQPHLDYCNIVWDAADNL